MASMTEILMNMAAQQAKTVGQQQENQYSSIRNQYAPETFQTENDLRKGQIQKIPAEIQGLLAAAEYHRAQTGAVPSEIALRNAQTANFDAERPFIATKWQLKKMEDEIEAQKLQQRMKEFNGAQSPYGKAVTDYQNLINSVGENNELTKMFRTYLGTEANPKGGMTLSVNPKTGEVTYQTGGAGGGKSTAGTTYIEPSTGKVFERPTKGVTGRLEKSVIGNEMVINGLDDLVKDVSPYLGQAGGFQKWIDQNATYRLPKGVQDFLTKTKLVDFDTISKTLGAYNYGIDTLTQRAENLLSGNNLNTTDQSIHDMKAVLMPREMDSEKTYYERVKKHIVELKRKQAEEERLLAQGIPVGQVAMPGATQAEMPQQQLPSNVSQPTNELGALMEEKKRRQAMQMQR